MSFLNAARFNSVHKKKFHCWNWSVAVSRIETSLAGMRCLVLDDEFPIALDIQNILETAGAASVLCAASAEAALAALREAEFDLAVLDLKLGGAATASLAVAAALTKLGTPFIFLTGMLGDYIHLRDYPDVPAVDKPYQTLLLLEAIRRALAAG
jgi:CheY-like chemotaxis protein